MVALMELTERMREILQCRSVKNKIAIPRHCELVDPQDLPIISQLVREGYMRFMRETKLMMAARRISDDRMIEAPLSVDVYELTETGIALCEQHGIKQV
jgi:hypothetical protein